MPISADSNQKLIAQLDSLPSNPGSRISGRNQEEKENYALKNYGKILLSHGLINYPISIQKQESPDYWIVENGSAYGIEITESTSEPYQMLLTEWERRPGTYIEPDKIQYGRSYSRQEILDMITPDDEPLSGPGWMGRQAEGYAANWARDAALKKAGLAINWDEAVRKNMRIMLYQNCAAWICDKPTFAAKLKSNLVDGFQRVGIGLDEFRIDYLLTDCETLVFDAARDCKIMEMPDNLCAPGRIFPRRK